MNDDAIARFTDEDGDDNALPAEFATATMGHVLLGQGREAEARAVFSAVLARDPADAEARRGIALLDGPTEPAAATEPEPAAAAEPEPAYVRAIAMDPTTLVVHWSAPLTSLAHLTDRPGDAMLAVLVTSLRAGAVGILTSHRTLPLGGREGEIAVRDLESGAVHHVALTARINDRLVPFARAGGVHAPPEFPLPSLPSQLGPEGAAPLSVDAARARWSAGLASS